jgi:hypothetical protein
MRAAAACIVSLLIPAAVHADDPQLAKLLAAVAQYVEAYEPQLSAMVAEEEYHQKVRRGRHREEQRTVSDFLFLKLPGALHWVGFRDVYSIDGQPLRDPQDRFHEILNRGGDVERQAVELAAENARFNIGEVVRRINVPTLVLGWLGREPQRRFEFALEGRKTISGTRCRVVAFRERETPTLIRSRDDTDVPSSGSFCASTDGRVWMTELKPHGRVGRATVTVTYRLDPPLAMLVPHEMRERYREDRIECAARYSKYRRFSVTTRVR